MTNMVFTSVLLLTLLKSTNAQACELVDCLDAPKCDPGSSLLTIPADEGECCGSYHCVKTESSPCFPNPCATDQVCTPSPKACFTTPCPQYDCNPSKCPTMCTANYLPVCGSNGKTYSNACGLSVAACQQKENSPAGFPGITQAHTGPCTAVDCAAVSCLAPPLCEKGLKPVETGKNGCCSTWECPKECSTACTLEYNPVCGSDGETYGNACGLAVAACLHTQNGGVGVAVTQAYTGACSDKKPCPTMCPLNFAPVCGSNGKTYSNGCALGVAACESNGAVTEAHAGPCPDDCAAVTCAAPPSCPSGQQATETGKMGCCTTWQCKTVCPSICPEIYAPVCGSDGKTYSNTCTLGTATCQSNGAVTQVHTGACPTNCAVVKCAGPNCPSGQTVVETGKNGGCCMTWTCKTECPTMCPLNYLPVCGSDGKTYSNACALGVAACQSNGAVTQVGAGPCAEDCAAVSCLAPPTCGAGKKATETGKDGCCLTWTCASNSEASNSQASCKAFCGSKHPSGCFCDATCNVNGDCCPGYAAECECTPDSCPPASYCSKDGGCYHESECERYDDAKSGVCPTPGSCAGNCGSQLASGCWCDDGCSSFGDCCHDKRQQC